MMFKKRKSLVLDSKLIVMSSMTKLAMNYKHYRYAGVDPEKKKKSNDNKLSKKIHSKTLKRAVLISQSC